MSKQIKLGEHAVVTDPCHHDDFMCMTILRNLRPGMYNVSVDRGEIPIWGLRNKSLTVLHENIKSPVWEDHSNLPVDSGQLGVFCMTEYRDDEVADKLPWLTEKGDPFGGTYIKDDIPGEDWYVKMCDRTLNGDNWGVYDTGVVSSSGVGDGFYSVEVSEMDGQVHGIKITFIDE
jgi:hypothetical protein